MGYCRYEDEHGCRCCKKDAVYGKEPGKPIFCGPHNVEGWPDGKSPKCFCGLMATWGREDTKKKLYCAKHGKERGMVPIGRKECAHPGCKTVPKFALDGDPAEYCKTHAEEGMVDVVSKRCAVKGCDTRATHGREGGSAEYCGPHAEEGMKNVNAKECAHPGCETLANYAFKGDPAEYCGQHAEKGMFNVNSKWCKCCLFQVRKAPYLCSYCNPSKHQKTREMEIKALLESTTDLGTHIHDKSVGSGQYMPRPDFLFDALTHRVVVEVDEYQHKGYALECERIRMIKIAEVLKMPCVFVRYNPDTFHIDGKTVRVSKEKRHELLLKTIRECTKSPTADIVYLYYDGADVRTDSF